MIKDHQRSFTRELQRKMTPAEWPHYGDSFALYQRMLPQKRDDKHKLYSLYEPHIYCMSKGKAHQYY